MKLAGLSQGKCLVLSSQGSPWLILVSTRIDLQARAAHSLLEPHQLLFVFAKSRELKVELWMLFLDMNDLRNLVPPAIPRAEQVLEETRAKV